MQVRINRLTPGEGHYFYGYYDNYAMTQDGSRHLLNKVSFMDRLQKAGDVCNLGYLDRKEGNIKYFAKTSAWNFQQGCMLEWDPKEQNSVYYNDFSDGHYKSVHLNLETCERKEIMFPLADISPDGRYGLSVNFPRIYDFRPGYGYCNTVDSWKDITAPADDGIYLIDLRSGSGKLLIPYSEMIKYFSLGESTDGCKVVINHITFNAESDRFVFLIRCFPKGSDDWVTGIGTSDLEGNIYVLRNYTFASHYYWKENGVLLIYADCGEGDALYELYDKSQEYRIIGRELFTEDIHCSYSPDREWIIGDGYPNAEGYRPVFLYNIASDYGRKIADIYSPLPSIMDIRTDLHCRWCPDGEHVTFDSIHEGFRGIYEMDLSEALEEIKTGGRK